MGPCCTLPAPSNLRHRHDSLVAGRIHRVTIRRKDHIDTLPAADGTVKMELTRILRKVFRRSKLGGIDKHADDHGVAGETGRAYQGAVTRMQCAHRRYESDRHSLPVKPAAPGRHGREPADAIHG